MNIRLKLLLLTVLIPFVGFSQSTGKLYNDGPNIFFNPDNSVRVIAHINKIEAGKGEYILSDTVYSNISALGDLNITDHKNKWLFNIKNSSLHREISKPATYKKVNKGEKIFAISDSHGSFKHFVSILQSAGVINDKLAWNYGKNRLVVLGDTFDRGKDVVAILWLIYSLEEQAAKAGGAVSYLLGNHDNMVLKGDLRYVKDKYKEMATSANLPYNNFFSPQTFLGNWLRSKNTIEIIGNTLFVHAGISADFANSGISVEEANMLIGKYLDAPKNIYEKGEGLTDTLGKVKFLIGTNGPLWYRGLVREDEKYNPIKVSDLDKILKQYNVSRIVVGHTTFDGVKHHHGGKVISVDSENEEKDIDHLAQGVEIVGKRIKIITSEVE